MVKTLDVIWIHDQYIHPKDRKMAVIVEPDCLFYFRFNSSDRWQPALLVEKEPHHRFLKYDSFLQCDLANELTEFDVEQALNAEGVIGTVHASFAEPIYALVKANPKIANVDKRAIGLALVGAKRL